MLTLRTLGISGSGQVIGSEPYRYEVVGLPAGRGAMLARLSGAWKILKIEPGKNHAWTGSFVSADDALASLEGDVGTSIGDSADGTAESRTVVCVSKPDAAD